MAEFSRSSVLRHGVSPPSNKPVWHRPPSPYMRERGPPSRMVVPSNLASRMKGIAESHASHKKVEGGRLGTSDRPIQSPCSDSRYPTPAAAPAPPPSASPVPTAVADAADAVPISGLQLKVPGSVVVAAAPPRSSSLPSKPVTSNAVSITTEISTDSAPKELEHPTGSLPRSRSVNFHTNQHRWCRDDEPLVARSPGFLKMAEGAQRVVWSHHQPQYSDSAHYFEYLHSRRFMQALLVNEGITDRAGHQHSLLVAPSGSLARSHSEPRRWSARSIGRRKSAIERAVSGKKDVRPRYVMQETPSRAKFRRIIMNEADWKVSPTATSLRAQKKVYGMADEGQYTTSDGTGSTFKVNELVKTKIIVQTDPENGGKHMTAILPASGKKLPGLDEALMSGANGSTILGSKPAKRRSWRPQNKAKAGEDELKAPPPRLPVSFPRSESLHFDIKKFHLLDDLAITRDEISAAERSVDANKISPSHTARICKGPMAMVKDDTQPIERDFVPPMKSSIPSITPLRLTAEQSPDNNVTKDINMSQRAALLSRQRDVGNSDRNDSSRLSIVPRAANEPSLHRYHFSQTSQKLQEPPTLGSVASEGRSRSTSIISTATVTEHCPPEMYTGVLEDAQSVPMHKGTPRGPAKAHFKTTSAPGPPPRTPLPSVPEGQAGVAPVTPRNSTSEQRGRCADIPETKSTSSPKTYFPFPESSPRRSQSPTKRTSHSRQDFGHHKAAAKVIITNGIKDTPFPAPPSPERLRSNEDRRQESVLVGSPRMPAELPEMKVKPKPSNLARAEKTRGKKERDMARQKSQRAAIERYEQDAPPLPEERNASESPNDSKVRSPTPFREEENALLDIFSEYSEKGPDMLDISTAPKKSHHRKSSAFPHIFPIFTIAEQRPVAPVQRTSSQNSWVTGEGNESYSVSVGAQDIRLLASSRSVIVGDHESVQRTGSSATSQPGKPRLIAGRRHAPLIPEQFLHQNSNRSSQCSSMVDVSIEARISKLEELIMEFIAAGAEMRTSISGSETGEQFSRGGSLADFQKHERQNRRWHGCLRSTRQ